MERHVLRFMASVLAAGALGSTLGSASPHQPDAATAMPISLTVAVPYDSPEPRPVRIHLATPSPSPPPSPTPAATRTVAPAPPNLRPIPLPAIEAQEVALINLDTGRFLWQSNAHAAWAPASLTKIFTAMVAVDLIGMNATVTVPASIRQLPADSTFMGLTPGERLTVRELLDGIFLASGNDAAETLASAVTSRSAFVADMNVKAARLGLRTTHFTNPTGLSEAGLYSSAYDLALAAAYLESHYPALAGIAATTKLTIPATATHKTYTLVNLNKLLRTYPGTYGLKTGWTEVALGCLITASSRGGHRLLAVLLGAPNGTAYDEMPKVLDYGFEALGVLPRPATAASVP